jgi:hypothetical protein
MRLGYVRSMMFQSTTKFLPGSRWVLESLLFVADKFGDLSLQEPESWEVVGSGIGRLPPAPVRVSLINEAQLQHGSTMPRKTNSNPSGDKANHNLAGSTTTIYLIYQLPLELESEGDRQIYMVGQGEQLRN